MSEKLTGTIEWFNPGKGYGFIVRSDGKKPDIFVHYSDILMGGYKLLMAGDIVSFEIGDAFNGKPKATNVVLVERPRR